MASARGPSGSGDPATAPDGYDDVVLDLVERIPPGRVRSYGDVAADAWTVLGCGGPRQVGAVLAGTGRAVPWWRVVRADGGVPEHAELRALNALRAEGTPLRPDGRRVDMRRARVVASTP